MQAGNSGGALGAGVWSAGSLKRMNRDMARFRESTHISSVPRLKFPGGYREQGALLLRAAEQYAPFLREKHGLVFGSMKPWVEERLTARHEYLCNMWLCSYATLILSALVR